LLERINGPEDLKGLNITQLQALAGEIRDFLVRSISETGGHLASNLGVVELTIALLQIFDLTKDKIIWDVGHQSYIHKLLTGRRDAFPTLRQQGGLSGFPKNAESVYDAFDTGHASTAVSAALGIAAARDINNEGFSVIAVVGDGSMTGGLAYEALNNAGQLGSNLIVILNDNGMSISKSVGALSGYLSNLRTKPVYLKAKKGVKGILSKVPGIGRPISGFLDNSKKWLKKMLVGGGLFQNLGFNYIGPLDGHDLPGLIRVLGRVREMEGPILLHVRTIKGKGYALAETAPDNFHGVSAFNINTGLVEPGNHKRGFSDVFGEALTNLAEANEKLVAVTAAMPHGIGLMPFSKAFPKRFFDVGIAESHAVTFCAGLAKQGLVPVFAVYSTFLQRGYDQLIHDVCLQNLHVVLAIDRAGVVGQDGETHQGLFDISYLTHMPNMRVLCPRNGRELEEMLKLAVTDTSGPIAIRYPKDDPDALGGLTHSPVEIGKAERLLTGATGVAVAALGVMANPAYEACTRLNSEGYGVTLYSVRSAKPIDRDMIKALSRSKSVVTVEDNAIRGGFGERVIFEMGLLGMNNPPSVRAMGFPDAFIPHGRRGEIMTEHGLDAEGIYRAVRTEIERHGNK
jgi:1-deoxy-D-xylulose-5-phosphate synthase